MEADIRCANRRLGRPYKGHRREHLETFRILGFSPGRFPAEKLGAVDADRIFRQRMSDRLEAADRNAKLDSLPRVVGANGECAPCDAREPEAREEFPLSISAAHSVRRVGSGGEHARIRITVETPMSEGARTNIPNMSGAPSVAVLGHE